MLDAVVEEAKVDVPDPLVEARARELWDSMLHSLSHQGIDRDAYLRIAGKTEEELLEEAKPDAEQALRREAVLAAVVEAEGIEVSDDEVLEALQDASAERGAQAEEAARPAAQRGPAGQLKEDLAARKAVDLVVEPGAGEGRASPGLDVEPGRPKSDAGHAPSTRGSRRMGPRW